MEIIIGTSGWQYKHWNGLFYPSDVTGKAQLGYFANTFHSVEINSTFYHMPRLSTVENWAASVPDGFQFVVKLNRYITHTKRLVEDEAMTERLHEFLQTLQPLGGKLAAILVQLPPSMRQDLSRLEHLAQHVQQAEKEFDMRFPLALEFRHDSWFTEETYQVMCQYNIANVINDSPDRWPASRAVTADFAYIRFHGNRTLYQSSYTDEELQEWVDFICHDCAECKQVFCYFNNDMSGAAVQNARSMMSMIS